MSLVLQPQASFTIVRQIPNHLDSDTNYVQAVIRNAYTDAIIETVKLTDKGGQRFSKNWAVPADSSGQGFYVSVVTSVYTDTGYTTKNGNYGDDENTYLIQDRVLLARQGGAGGVDAFTIRTILQEEMAKNKPTFDALYGAIGALQREINRIPKDAPEMQWDKVLAAIDAVKAAIPDEAEETDLTPVLEAMKSIEKAIADKEVTPATDLTPILDRLTNDNEDSGIDLTEIKDLITGIEDDLVETVESAVSHVLETSNIITSFIPHRVSGVKPPKEPEEEPPLDINKLAG